MNTNPSRRKRLGLLTASFVALSLTAAACGSDSETATSEAVTTVAPVDTTAAPAPETTVATPDTTVDAGAPFGPACSAVPADGEGSFGGMADDPAATAASNNPVLSTLVAAVTAAGLVDTLNGPGPFTIFAPYNDAFAAIPAADLDAVLADKDLLTSILTYHVIGGQSLDAAALGEAGTLETVNGASLEFGADGTTVNGAKVLCSNVVTANATVHIIDTVLMPPAEASALLEPSGPACSAVPADGEGSFGGMADDPAATAASNNPVLSTLVAAVTAAGLVDTLNGPGPFTIFAPYNDAFAAIPAADLDAVLADKDLLTSILTLHVVAGEKMSSADLITAGTVETINGESLTFTDVDGALTINGSVKSICMDVPTANATVHIIDSVLMPAG